MGEKYLLVFAPDDLSELVDADLGFTGEVLRLGKDWQLRRDIALVTVVGAMHDLLAAALKLEQAPLVSVKRDSADILLWNHIE